MRIVNIATLVCCVLFSATAASQTNKPSSQTEVAHVTALPGPPNSYVANFRLNYVRTKEAMGKFTDAGTFNSQNYTHVKEATQYLDGLGRPFQTVVRQASPGETPKDLVAPVVYDPFGLEHITYLPFVESSGTHTSDGSFKVPVFSDQSNFYNSVFPAEQPDLTAEDVFFSYKVFELSPVNRPIKTMAAGNSWAGNGRGVTFDYMVNTSADAVKIWTISSDALTFLYGDNTTNIPTSSVNFAAGELFKNVTKDEQGNAVVEYKDKEGQVILKKVQIDDIAEDYSGYTGFLCTYYVYDDLNQLRFVIPPRAVEWLIGNSWNFSNGTGTTEVVPELCFRYEYDTRQRMISKKVPGADWVHLVYDKRDRLIFSQDVNMRLLNKWMATLYDVLNRPVLTGFITYTGNRQQLQNYADAATINAVSQTVAGDNPASFPAELTLNEYTAGVHQASAGINLDPGFESAPDFTAEIATGGGSSSFTNSISTASVPLPSGHNLDALTMTFYEDYAWTSKTYTTQNNGLLPGDETIEHAQILPTQTNMQTKGIVTGTKVKNLGNGEWLTAVNFYDDRMRVIQTSSINHTGGEDVSTSRYDFTGKVLSSLLVHTNPLAGVSGLKVLTRMHYDHAGRLMTIKKKINDGEEIVIAENEYDAMGQLKRKKLGSKKDANGNYTIEALETLDYTYNIRGWLKGINKDYSNSTGQADRWFGMELSYDWGFTTNQFNGNISGTKWRSKGDGERRAYGFGYDKANRILAADFNQYTNSAWNKDAGINFSSFMGDGATYTSAYDANGNILAMKQWGLKGTTSQVIDDLTYLYHGNTGYSNKLGVVDESEEIAATNNKLGDFTDKSRGTNDYFYDANGNMVVDNNKNISSIHYNHLNLPDGVTLSGIGENNNGWGNIYYAYDATGNKLEKYVMDASGTTEKLTTTDYLSGFVYECNCGGAGSERTSSSNLQFFGHEEGRVRYIAATPTSSEKWVFDYFVKDHLGNTRVVLTDEQQTDAYPAATMETAQATTEEALYKNISETRTDKSTISGYPTDNYTNPNDKAAKVNGSGNKIGPAILLKVMAGDKFNLRVNSWYKKNGALPTTFQNPLVDIVTALINGVPGISGGHIQAGDLTSTILNPNINNYLDNRNSGNTYTVKPKAYVNAILLDDQFKAVTTSGKDSWFEQVGDNLEFKEHLLQGREISKNGYLYIYLSNETENLDVFFDNLQVSQIRGPLVEETHYYPFGLTMGGISSKALAFGKENKKNKFQNQEFNDDLAVDYYEFKWRHHDPQIGRFIQIDPLADDYEYNSTYAFSENQVTAHVELEGLEKVSIHSQSFIPYRTLGMTGEGGKYSGDNRGFGQAGNSRISATVNLDLSGNKGITKVSDKFKGADTYDSKGKLITYSDASGSSILSGNKKFGDLSDANLSFEIAGNNEAIAGSPDIDVKGKFALTSLTFGDGSSYAAISGSITGDKFPANETFLTDQKGQVIFLGVSGADGSPLTSLPGNNNRKMSSFTIGISFDSKGNATGVSSNGKNYTFEEWNKKFTTLDAKGSTSTNN